MKKKIILSLAVSALIMGSVPAFAETAPTVTVIPPVHDMSDMASDKSIHGENHKGKHLGQKKNKVKAKAHKAKAKAKKAKGKAKSAKAKARRARNAVE